jgi:hypothetical protein
VSAFIDAETRSGFCRWRSPFAATSDAVAPGCAWPREHARLEQGEQGSACFGAGPVRLRKPLQGALS